MEIRISVCLTRYFEDERSYCYMMVEQRSERVAALEQRLRSLFRLRGSFCLMSRDHYLPPDEKLSVLGPDDTVTIVPLESCWWNDEDCALQSEVKCKNEQDEQSETSPLPADDAMPPETAALVSVVDKNVKKKKKKKVKSESLNEANDEADVAMSSSKERSESRLAHAESMDQTHEVESQLDALSQLKLKALNLLHEVTGGASGGTGAVSGVSGGRVTKRRRVRRRNRRASAIMPDSPSSSRSATPSLSPTTSEVTLASGSLPAPNSTRMLHSPSASNSKSASFPVSESVPAHTNITTVRFPSDGGPPAVVQNAGAENVRGPRVVRAEGEVGGSVEDTHTALSVAALQRRLHEFPVMDAVTYPMPRDLVLFKTVRVEGGAARTSGGVLARVLRVDKTTAAVALKVLDGADELRAVGRELSPGDELLLPWAAVLDPRLIFL
ncbi:hypothetical protein EVAR_90903_1 [Eumeta japonica]|uniref:Coilin N-terminal domain-containing protein n=1 Tax=Eumeta variegata TaxID=151549 RepID=A0A4C2A3R8_EUMVA|nr:hypothetical protein EVAR_90903_1 [Eumeta japonica]